MEKETTTHKIIGCAYQVHNKLGFGFFESVYHNAMMIELAKHDLNVESEKAVRVYYENQIVGNFSADLFVDNSVIVELKSVQQIVKAHEVQLVNYLNGLKLDIGLLINFGPVSVDVKRKYRRTVGQD